jgi:2-oxo-4-hydroxy-4-carboxy-5-ureidoimidazoline decarboxylase
MPQHQLTIAEINALDRHQFVDRLGFVFEQSPWIAEQAWDARPFRDRDHLQRVMVDVVENATIEQQIALIRAHPDLAGKAAIAGELTAESTREQSGAGLDRLSPAEFARFTHLNQSYRDRFGFPFVICVRDHTKESILAAFEDRLKHDRNNEIATALIEIAKIANLRLQDRVSDT